MGRAAVEPELGIKKYRTDWGGMGQKIAEKPLENWCF